MDREIQNAKKQLGRAYRNGEVDSEQREHAYAAIEARERENDRARAAATAANKAAQAERTAWEMQERAKAYDN